MHSGFNPTPVDDEGNRTESIFPGAEYVKYPDYQRLTTSGDFLASILEQGEWVSYYVFRDATMTRQKVFGLDADGVFEAGPMVDAIEVLLAEMEHEGENITLGMSQSEVESLVDTHESSALTRHNQSRYGHAYGNPRGNSTTARSRSTRGSHQSGIQGAEADTTDIYDEVDTPQLDDII